MREGARIGEFPSTKIPEARAHVGQHHRPRREDAFRAAVDDDAPCWPGGDVGTRGAGEAFWVPWGLAWQ